MDTPVNEAKIECKECGKEFHAIPQHLKAVHDGMSEQAYQEKHPGAPLYSEFAIKRMQEVAAKKQNRTENAMANGAVEEKEAALHELFELGNAPEALSRKGAPIKVRTYNRPEHASMLFPIDPGHVWEIDNLKNILMALELNIPIYAWGHMGTGKTTSILQVCARTGRPCIRVQHTLNTEEAHIIGQRVARGHETPFEWGPLPLAMMYGWVYIADEYDFGLPSILSVYQPVLEGHALVVKEADAAQRVIRPHPLFRFVATGNTNGGGDETGLYQGTSPQNAANYDRFGMVLKFNYMDPAKEAEIVATHSGVGVADAKKLVSFASMIREAYDTEKMSTTISPRSLINAAKIGLRRADWRSGLALAFINKLNKIDREVATEIAQREFG